MDNIESLTFDELIEVYKIIEDYIKFLNGELQNYNKQGEEQWKKNY